MRKIDMQNWSRREHFNTWINFDQPIFGMSVNVDLTMYYPYAKAHDFSFTVGIVYLMTSAANAIPEFRRRIRGEEVVEHDLVHPSITLLTDDDLFSFCTFNFSNDFSAFAPHAVEIMAYTKANPTLEDEPGRDDLLFMTAIPWVSFTSFDHPMHLSPPISVPQFAWGKYFNEGERIKMPLSVHGHHAIMDGIHIGRYFQQLQGYLDEPETVMGK
jgi:chloramphenicol O-acetyltransferase type A